jgi:hypothetical protein
MKKALQQVALRKNAVLIPQTSVLSQGRKEINETTSVFLANCSKLGYTFSEDLLETVNAISPREKLEIFELLKEVTGVNKNWTPLVKQWNIPTGESVVDHIITWFANVFQSKQGTRLHCGHIIPDNTFPLERYNGCPFCGTPFEFAELDYEPGKNKLKVLSLWTEEDLIQYSRDLLQSPVALDATQAEDVKILIGEYGVPADTNIGMKETKMLVIDTLVEQDKADDAGALFHSPTDILRYLWFKHTGFLQIVEPKTIVNRMAKNSRNYHYQLDKATETKVKALNDLKLKFNRESGRRYATWLNNLSMSVESQCENMHPKRGMWVRVIRALRLAEYSKRKGFEKLAALLDAFYNERYEVWQGKVNRLKLKSDAEGTFALLT